MGTQVLVQFVDIFVAVFTVLLLVRVLMSYVMAPDNRLYAGVAGLTEPLLAPIRRLLPRTPGLDLAPLVGWVVLQLVQSLVHRFVG